MIAALLLVAAASVGSDVPSTSTRPVAVESRPVVLEMEGCPSVSEPALRALVRTELGPLLVDAPQSEAERVTVSCAGDSATVAVENPPDERRERVLSLAGFPPDARPRLLALVAVELVAARRPETHERQATRLPAPPAPLPVTASASAAPPAHGLRLLAGGGARAFLGERGLLAWTAGLRAEPALTPRLDLAVDVELGGGRRALALGAVGGLLASGAAVLRLRAPGDGWGVAGGAGVRFGVARLAGEPARAEDGARSRVRPWGGPIGTLALERGSGHGCVAVGLEAGWAVVGARGLAEEALVLAVSGPWVGMTLSGGWRR